MEPKSGKRNKMTRWAMVIDTRHCIGCKTCVQACSQANDIAEGAWRKVKEFGEPEYPDRSRHFLTRACMHCEVPLCLNVCPTTATYRRQDGIVAVDPDKCVGCGACILACPYDARVLYTPQHDFESGRPVDKRRKGTCTKCHFCLPRIEKGIEKGLKPGVDPDATPLCVVTCSSGALHFGDLDDPDSEVTALIENNPSLRLAERLGTKPAVYYIID